MSKRQYINPAYLTNYLHGQSLSSDFPTPDDLIEMAEEMIDGYVGPTQKWFQLDSSFVAGVYTPPDYEPETPVVKELRGKVNSVVNASTYMVEFWQQNAYQNGFFGMCNLDIMGGTGFGNSYLISDSLYTGQITIKNTDGSTITEAPLDTTSVYRIYQLGQFPRNRDVFYNTFENPTRYYKQVPEKVRQATAAQCEYINKQGLDFFTSDAGTMQTEHIGPYSYGRRGTTTSSDILIAPKTRMLLKGLKNRRGTIVI